MSFLLQIQLEQSLLQQFNSKQMSQIDQNKLRSFQPFKEIEKQELFEKKTSHIEIYREVQDVQQRSTQVKKRQTQSQNEQICSQSNLSSHLSSKFSKFPKISSKCFQIDDKKVTNYSSKTHQIKKQHKKQKPKLKLNPSSSSLPSNLNKKFLSLIKDVFVYLQVYDAFEKMYLEKYQINNQRQNVIILPFCVLDFLIKLVDNRFEHIEINTYQNQLIIQNMRKQINFYGEQFNLILTNFRESIERSEINRIKKLEKQSKQIKKIKQSNNYETYAKIISFFQKQLPNIFIKLVAQKYGLVSWQVTNNRLEQKESNNDQISSFNSSSEEIYPVKVQQEAQLYYVQQRNEQQKKQIKLGQKNSLSYKCLKFFQSIFESKEREITKANQKLFSIILNESHLRQVFDIQNDFKINFKQCVHEAFEYVFRRYFGQKKIKHEKSLHKHYQRMENIKLYLESTTTTVGEDFLISLMVISLIEDKNCDILQEFIESIKRRTQFLFREGNDELIYSKQHYIYYLNLLQKYDFTKTKTIIISMKDWIYRPQQQRTNEVKMQVQEQHTMSQNIQLSNLNLIINEYVKLKEQFMQQTAQFNGFFLQFDSQAISQVKIEPQFISPNNPTHFTPINEQPIHPKIQE